jgi:hypothetical protein
LDAGRDRTLLGDRARILWRLKLFRARRINPP